MRQWLIFLNSTTFASYPLTFSIIYTLEIGTVVFSLLLVPWAIVAIYRAELLHRNARLMLCLFFACIALAWIGRLVLFIAQLSDVPICDAGTILITATVVRDTVFGYACSLLIAVAFERYIALSYWAWYEKGGMSTLLVLFAAQAILIIPSFINVVLWLRDYYDHMVNYFLFVLFSVIGCLTIHIAYARNKRIARHSAVISANNISSYSLPKSFQLRENARVFLLMYRIFISTIPLNSVCFLFFGLYQFLPHSHDGMRHISIALFDLGVAVYGAFFIIYTLRTEPTFRAQFNRIIHHSPLTAVCKSNSISGEAYTISTSSIAQPENIARNITDSYFRQLADSWA